ncbi:MAG: DUF2298 domain-containing protein, partial [Candidatus Daviesbacteria bacterium]|nr:DUF2298 domain-containing protein [Candidatus Daviesbacteria bacterium]
MIISDLINVLYWWLIFFVISLVFLPLTSKIFSSFFDKGYAFSKILGLLLISYTVWLLASLKILPFNFFSIILVLIPFLLINLKFLKELKLLKIYFLEEGLFLGGFIFWAFIKAHEPSIHGLEKFMDFGFINSTLRSDFFPPKDMWLAPETINYYYFGHFISALLIKFTNVLPEIGYNLTLASLFGLCFSASFSIGSNLYNFFLKSKQSSPLIHNTFPIIPGLISAFLVTLGGNLQTIYIFFQSYKTENPVPFWLLPLVFNPDGYWYPNATRFIPFTIHEFPIYSFVVSDLHGHVFDIPFVLLLIALLIKIFFSSKFLTFDFCLLSLLIAVFLMTNVLDGPIYLLVILAVFLVKKLITPISLISLISQITLIIIGAIIFSLPFWFSFKPFASGIGVVCAPDFLINISRFGPFLFEADHCARSPLWMLLILWGFPLFIVLTFLFKHLNFTHLSFRGRHGDRGNLPVDILALILAGTAFILILIPEFFYAKDIYPA